MGNLLFVITYTATHKPYQRSTAEEDHEDDERFKPVVLHDNEAGLPQCPPALIVCSLLVDLAALEPAHTACRRGGNVASQTPPLCFSHQSTEERAEPEISSV